MIAATATVALSGCGGGTGSASGTSQSQSAPAISAAAMKRYIARAEPICRRSIVEVHALGEHLAAAAGDAESIGATVASGLVKPGIEILSDKAADLRAIRPAPNAADLNVYLGLFDPIVELSRQLLQAAEANDGSRLHELELIVADLGREQSAAARGFGFRDCALGFTDSLGGVG